MIDASNINSVKPYLITIFSALCAYFESTQGFMIALFLAFTLNILAGLRADKVKFKMTRFLKWELMNFSGHKFKDSLIELTLIVVVTYLLKGIVDLMDHSDKSVFMVECLVWIALYNYLRNGMRNLNKAYPNKRWFRVLYYLVSFHFSKFAPESVKRAWEKSEKKELDE